MSKKKSFDLSGRGDLNSLKDDLKNKMDNLTRETIENLNESDFVDSTSVDNVIAIVNNDKYLNQDEKKALISRVITEFTELFTFSNCPDDYETLKLEAKYLSNITQYSIVMMAHRLLKISNEGLYVNDNYASFKEFVENELNVSRRTAYNYIELVEHFGEMLTENKKLEYSKLLPVIPVIKLIPDKQEKESIKKRFLDEAKIKSKRDIIKETDKLKNIYGMSKKKNIYNEIVRYIENRLHNATEIEKQNLMEIIKKLNSFK
jgi:hypothetical protein